MSPAAQALLAATACLALQAGLWATARRIRNWSLVDPGWAAGIALCAAVYCHFGEAPLARRVAATACAALWGVRHAWLLLRHRVVGRPEEGRYAALRGRWGDGAFLAFFLGQGLLSALLSAPFLLAATAAGPWPAPSEAAGLALVAAGLVGEAVADAQLARFKRDPTSRGRACRIGLWAWSRHPNYFFEFVIWCGFALLASAAPGGAAAWGAPALLLLLMLFVTGIPPTERQALRSRGDDYRAYQREVSAFVPWPPRREKGGAP